MESSPKNGGCGFDDRGKDKRNRTNFATLCHCIPTQPTYMAFGGFHVFMRFDDTGGGLSCKTN